MNLHFDLRDLELFVAVAEAGSIARAAERCHTVSSAVSKRLSDLERDFGAALLVRGARGVELTAAGHSLHAAARRMLHQAQRLNDELRQYAAGQRGYVRVFANMSAIVQFLPSALGEFLLKHPDVHVHLEERISSAVAEAVAENSADIGIVGELPALEGLTTMPYRQDELVIVARAQDAIARHESVLFAEALDYPFVSLNAESSLQRTLVQASTDAGRSLNLRIQVTSFDAVFAMVAAGLGIGVVPRAVTTPYVATLGLRLITLRDAWARRQLFLCVRSGEKLPTAAQLLLEHLRA